MYVAGQIKGQTGTHQPVLEQISDGLDAAQSLFDSPSPATGCSIAAVRQHHPMTSLTLLHGQVSRVRNSPA